MSVRYSEGAWLIEGDLPKGLVSEQTAEGLRFATVFGDNQPECFGLGWQAPSAGSLEGCDVCMFEEVCSEKMLGGKFASRILEGGNRPLESELAKEWETDEETIGELYSRYDARSKVKGTQAPGTLVPNPTRAPFVASAMGGAFPKRGLSVTPVRVPGGQKRGEKWKPRTYVRRCLKERRQSDYLSVLPVGTVLVTRFLGVEYRCLCLPTGWLYQGQVYPTLQSVTTEIAGVPRPRPERQGVRPSGTRILSNYSAARFWRLHRVVPEILRQIGYSPGSATMDTLKRWEEFSGGGRSRTTSG